MEIGKNYVKIRRPDDCHNHLREGQILKLIAPTLNIYGRVVAMGNLADPVVSRQNVEKYCREIKSASRGNCVANRNRYAKYFEPVMSVMFVNSLTPEILKASCKGGARILKLIPGGTSTNSSECISFYQLPNFYPVIKEAMRLGMILSVHAELLSDKNGNEIHPLGREAASLPFLEVLARKFPDLKIVLEHLSSRESIAFVERHKYKNIAGSLTEKHALMTFADVCNSRGEIIRGMNYCKPIFKLREDRAAVRKAMTSGNPRFFFGSDSAPHQAKTKLRSKPAAGIYSHAKETLALLAEIFESESALPNLEKFTSENWARFASFPLNSDAIAIEKKPHRILNTFGFSSRDFSYIPVFKGGDKVGWTVAENS